MELHRETKDELDISDYASVLEYEYTGDTVRMVAIRVELGDEVNPIVGAQSYEIVSKIDGVAVTPVSTVQVPAEQTRAILQSRQFVLESADVLTVEIKGGADDLSVNTIAILVDVTPVRSSDLTGAGSVVVDHNYGGEDELAIVTTGGVSVAQATIRAYRKANYDAGQRSAAFILGWTLTDVNGRWIRPLMLDPGSYTLYIFKPGSIQSTVSEIIVE